MIKASLRGKKEKAFALSLIEHLTIPYLEILHFSILEIVWDYKMLKELVPEEIKRNFLPGNLKYSLLR